MLLPVKSTLGFNSFRPLLVVGRSPRSPLRQTAGSMHSASNNQDRHPDIRQIAPGESLSTAGILVSDVSPRITEWVPELLDELLPSSVRTLREYIAHTDPGILSHGRYGSLVGKLQADTLGVTHREWGSTTDTWSDDEAEAVEYLHSLFDCAVKYHDTSTDELSSYHQQRETETSTLH